MEELRHHEDEKSVPSVSIEERTNLLIDRIRELLSGEDHREALALFNELHSVDKGKVLVDLPPEPQQEFLTTLPPEDTAEILEHLEPGEAVQVTEQISSEELPRVLDEVRPEVAADILKQLPTEQSAEALRSMLGAKGVIPLLRYSDDSAGGLMTPEYLAVSAEETAATALDGLRIIGPKAERVSTVFVVDDKGKLVGTLGVTTLALSRPKTLVKDIMDPETIYVTAETDQEECARLIERYDVNYLPVVDEEHKLIGVILIEDVVDVVEEEATEDMYRMAGMGGERLLGPVTYSLRTRLPWLYINLATAFLAAGVVALFESTIAKAAVLAAFLPIIAGQGGIGGTQTLTLVVRSIALGQLLGQRAVHLLTREILVGLIHGVLLGLVVGLITLIWKGNGILGLIVGLAMAGNMVIAGLTGAGVPLLLRRLKLDPAVSSAIFVTTFTDVIGFFFLLGLATLLIRFLI